MERLLVLRLESQACEAEAVFNGVPLLRVGPGRPVALLPVHEFTFSGTNRLELVVQPGPVQALGAAPAPEAEPWLSDGQRWASLRLLLPRGGGVASPASARTLGQLDWAPAADVLCEWPTSLQTQVDLPIAFPRWRWVDAPVVQDSPTLKREVAAYLRDIALGLARGNPEPLVQASRLRLEDLAQAYQRNLADDVGRLRLQVQQWFAAQPLKPALPTASNLVLRPVAGGRLLECLKPDGSPVLQSAVPGGQVAWPVRLAAIDGRFYVLR
jgi:hypothetical protein